MPRIIPSIASAPALSMGRVLDSLCGCGSLHIDIEDGNFIPNITFGLRTVRELRSACTLPFNAHLMVTNPADYLRPLMECGCTELAFHLESAPYPLSLLHEVKALGMKVGLAFNFSTPIAAAEPFARETEFFLVMTSEPDGARQAFRRESLPRIRAARALLPVGKSIWVDGGVGANELPEVLAAGADTVIMGRAVVCAENPLDRVREFSKV